MPKANNSFPCRLTGRMPGSELGDGGSNPSGGTISRECTNLVNRPACRAGEAGSIPVIRAMSQRAAVPDSRAGTALFVLLIVQPKEAAWPQQ
jgi:hypothetical protein